MYIEKKWVGKRRNNLQVCNICNKCNNVVPTVLLLYCDSHGVVLDEEQPYITQFPLSIINWKHINIRTIKYRHQCSKRIIIKKNTVDVFWSGLGTSIFGKSSLAANNNRSRLPSRLSFRFYDYDFIYHLTRQPGFPVFTLVSYWSRSWPSTFMRVYQSVNICINLEHSTKAKVSFQ